MLPGLEVGTVRRPILRYMPLSHLRLAARKQPGVGVLAGRPRRLPFSPAES